MRFTYLIMSVSAKRHMKMYTAESSKLLWFLHFFLNFWFQKKFLILFWILKKLKTFEDSAVHTFICFVLGDMIKYSKRIYNIRKRHIKWFQHCARTVCSSRLIIQPSFSWFSWFWPFWVGWCAILRGRNRARAFEMRANVFLTSNR